MTIIITGSNGNIGKHLCAQFLKNEAFVFGLDLQEQSLTKHNNFNYFQCDITDKKKLIEIKEKILKKKKKIFVLINNAALDAPPKTNQKINKLNSGMLENYCEDEFDLFLKTNTKGTFLVSQIFGTIMAKQNKGGSIINISSIYGLVSPDQSIYEYTSTKGNRFYKPIGYSVSKGAIYNMTRFMAEYWAKSNVRVNTLTLSGIENNQDEEFIKNYTQRIPIGRMASLKDITGAIFFLSSNASKYITGSNLIVDGGWTII